MKMNARKAGATSVLLVGLALAVCIPPALSAEISYCPNSYGRISVDGHTVMRIWGVPGIDSGHAVSANPDYDWPTEAAIVLWRDALLSAKRSGTCVTLYYDGSSKTDSDGNTVHDLWSVSESN